MWYDLLECVHKLDSVIVNLKSNKANGKGKRKTHVLLFGCEIGDKYRK